MSVCIIEKDELVKIRNGCIRYLDFKAMAEKSGVTKFFLDKVPPGVMLDSLLYYASVANHVAYSVQYDEVCSFPFDNEEWLPDSNRPSAARDCVLPPFVLEPDVFHPGICHRNNNVLRQSFSWTSEYTASTHQL